MKRMLLMLPGPMQVPDQVAEAALRPLFFHRSPQFQDFREALRQRARPLFGTTGEILFMSGPATAAMESSVVNLVSPREEIIVIVGGTFAERWAAIGRAFGLHVHVLEVDWRVGATRDDVVRAMERWPGAEVVFITWSESSTGVLIDMDGIGDAVRERGKFLVADAVSGLAVSPLAMDDWKIDVVVSGSQKGLMLPPGLALIAVGSRVWAKAASAALPRFVLDWEPLRTGVPSTPALSLMLQLDAALDLIESMGPGGIYERRAEVADRIRALVSDCSLEIYARRPGNGITALILPDGLDGQAVRERLETECDIVIAGGLGKLAGKTLRIGHVGQLTDAEIEYFSHSFRATLTRERGAS